MLYDPRKEYIRGEQPKPHRKPIALEYVLLWLFILSLAGLLLWGSLKYGIPPEGVELFEFPLLT